MESLILKTFIRCHVNILLLNYYEAPASAGLSITSDNGSEFSNLSSCLENITDVYFARPYASYERGSNGRHNGLLMRYISKGKAISDYSRDSIKRAYQTLNNLPRKILNSCI